jgi:hypothetical protein
MSEPRIKPSLMVLFSIIFFRHTPILFNLDEKIERQKTNNLKSDFQKFDKNILDTEGGKQRQRQGSYQNV